MNRRAFAQHSLAFTLALMLGQRLQGATQESPAAATAASDIEKADQAHLEAMERFKDFLAAPKATIGMLVYPGMFLQDLVGPLAVFEALMHREIHLVWKDRQPLRNLKAEHQTLIPVTPTTSFADCPSALDVLFVPGGVPGTLVMMEDPEVLSFLGEAGKRARYVTSVCTGSLILGAAGLLRGYRATSHWVTRDVLKELGAEPSPGRVVVDRNRITGGGVTAGIDFGLTIAEQLTSRLYAQAIQLYLEYDPQPPFDAGSPEKAPARSREFLDAMFAGLRTASLATAQRAWKRLQRDTD